jgi:inner membrane protein YidH
MAEDDFAPDATRRTWLANERTWLAWLRTGLGALAVALAVGKVVPNLADTSHRWPYEVVGVGYALLGIALVAYGARRRQDVDEAVARGSYSAADARAIAAFVWGTVVLGVATAVLVIID